MGNVAQVILRKSQDAILESFTRQESPVEASETSYAEVAHYITVFRDLLEMARGSPGPIIHHHSSEFTPLGTLRLCGLLVDVEEGELAEAPCSAELAQALHRSVLLKDARMENEELNSLIRGCQNFLGRDDMGKEMMDWVVVQQGYWLS